jgi:Bacterial PH domain
MIFKASLDKLTLFVTIIITILFLAIGIGSIYLEKDGKSDVPIYVDAFLFLIYVMSYALSPKSYEINEKSLIIKRPFKDVIIDRSQIASATAVESSALRWSVRTFGVGGLFGYFGKFWNKEFGDMTWYASQRSHTVLITTNDQQKIILTPDQEVAFVKEVMNLN